jgi:hypothetical protein
MKRFTTTMALSKEQITHQLEDAFDADGKDGWMLSWHSNVTVSRTFQSPARENNGRRTYAHLQKNGRIST